MARHMVAVIGSLNVDFITRTSRIPDAGETLTANSFDTGFGGKGANQAVACARLADPDVKVQMVGVVGDDIFGADYYSALEREGIDTSGVRKLPGQKTGIANIIVEEGTGENRILLAPNANHAFSAEQDECWDIVPEAADVVVFQLEIPLLIVLNNIQKASARGKHVILNPAPAISLPTEIYKSIDTLILNETEAVTCGGHHDSIPQPSEFLAKGVKDAVIITLGGDGLIYATASGKVGRLPARKATVVDTTAAGDTFVGAYTVQRAKTSRKDFDHERALDFATLAASKTVERKGAMAAIPRLIELS